MNMEDNRTNSLCEQCNSHITKYRDEEGTIITECSYCGSPSNEILDPLDWEDFK